MSFLDLNDDVKSIVSKHLSTDMNISKMVMSKHYDLQKMLFGEIVFDEEYKYIKIKQTPGRISDDDDFNNGNIYIYII